MVLEHRLGRVAECGYTLMAALGWLMNLGFAGGAAAAVAGGAAPSRLQMGTPAAPKRLFNNMNFARRLLHAGNSLAGRA